MADLNCSRDDTGGGLGRQRWGRRRHSLYSFGSLVDCRTLFLGRGTCHRRLRLHGDVLLDCHGAGRGVDLSQRGPGGSCGAVLGMEIEHAGASIELNFDLVACGQLGGREHGLAVEAHRLTAHAVHENLLVRVARTIQLFF